jgi:Ran GTPase-activating protein (RanGAP) involved in mRNA processing and transport
VNSTLTTIDLTYNSIGDEGYAALADALKVNSTLTTINLFDNSIEA